MDLRTRKPIHWGRVVAYAILIIHLLVTLIPLYIMIVTSLKTNKEIFSSPLALPSSFNLDGYRKVLKLNDFPRFFCNSIFVTIISIIIYTLVSLLAAYAITRFRFRGSNAFYIYFLLGMMVPIRIGVLNMFEMFKKLNLTDSLWGLILIYSAMGIGFSVFIMSGFMRSIPKEIEEAARIDGCSSFRILWTILVPILKPAIATAVIYNFVPIWNDFYFPLIFIKNEKLKTIPIAVTIFFGQFQTDWPTVFAALSLAALPALIFYFLMSKQFIKGLTAGAVKE
ncbi:MAG: carbohydrate ABC transporter permease [Candidatus Limivicinus sp.]